MTLWRRRSPSPAQYGYRNKVEFVVDVSTGRPRLGFHRAGSEEFVPVDECLLLPEKYRRAPKALGGALRYIAGRAGPRADAGGASASERTRAMSRSHSGEHPGPFPRRPVATTLGQALRTTSLVRVLVKGPAKERKIAGVEVLSGKGAWRERLLGTTMTVSAPSFFQVNTRAAESLVTLALEALAADGSDRVLDLFAGAGTFTLPLAEKAGEVVAVESASSAVRDLRRNLEDEGLWADVIGGDAGRELPAIGRVDLALVDPPRSGLQRRHGRRFGADRAPVESRTSRATRRPSRATPPSWSSGATPSTRATPVDLFPQTFHVETLALFERTP